MRVVPIRLTPSTDLRLFLEQVLQEQKEQAGWVLSGIGSLSVAPLRLAGQEELTVLEGDLEILTLSGSLSPDGAHLHISVADSQGRVSGGHLAMGATVRTTAEVLVALLPACSFRRELDPSTGFTELIIQDQA
jgi:predicted DNA-binding protein with PD1-like motif